MSDLKRIGTLSVNDAIGYIEGNNFFLPSFQRDFSWDYKKIEQLFDSIYNSYPVSDIILLEITEKEKKLLSYYEIKRNLSENIPLNNTKKRINTSLNQYCIMDGQQRLTSLYTGICGEIRCKKTDKVNSVLCFNLISSREDDDINVTQKTYNGIFEYRKKGEYDVFENKLWIDVNYLFDCDNEDELIEHALKRYGTVAAQKLIYSSNGKFKRSEYSQRYQALISNIKKDKKLIKLNIKKFNKAFKVNKSLVYNVISLKNYKTDEEKSNALYEIFLRLNSGGKPLSPAELLYSKIDIALGNKDFKVREVFKQYLLQLNYGETKFSFSIDFLMRSLWYIFGTSTFKAFMMSDIQKYCREEQFNNVIDSIEKARDYYVLSGFDARKMSYNILLPIAYYTYYGGEYNDSIAKEIAKYFSVAVATGYFGSSSDSTLMKIRKVLKNGDENKLELFKDKKFNFNCFQEALLKETEGDKAKKFKVTIDDINSMLKTSYKDDYDGARNVLFLISKWINVSKSNTVKYAEDHIHPKKFRDINVYKSIVDNEHFDEEEYKFFCANYNNIANLQILDGQSNSAEKNDASLLEWYKSQQPETIKALLERSFVVFDDVNELELYNFRNFYEKRRNLLKEKLCELFDVKNDK